MHVIIISMIVMNIIIVQSTVVDRDLRRTVKTGIDESIGANLDHIRLRNVSANNKTY